MPKKQSPWIAHVLKTFNEGKKKNPKYQYKNAMKDAKKTYKK
tara:strand:+ start:1428 stop:1553 length:126 start_codon:yes stop_codon:yes gene_type:complete